MIDGSTVCVRVGNQMSLEFLVASGVCQGCVTAPDSFAAAREIIGKGNERHHLRQCAFTDLDFADDISVLAELLELLVPALATFQEEAAQLGLEMK